MKSYTKMMDTFADSVIELSKSIKNTVDIQERINCVIKVAEQSRELIFNLGGIKLRNRYPHIKEDIDFVIHENNINESLLNKSDYETLISQVLDRDCEDYNNFILDSAKAIVNSKQEFTSRLVNK